MANLRIASYNSHGHGAGRMEYIQKLANEHDVILIQEHWLHSKQHGFFENLIPSCHVSMVSGMQSNELLQGRPYGGCAILWRKSMDCKYSHISFNSNRIIMWCSTRNTK